MIQHKKKGRPRKVNKQPEAEIVSVEADVKELRVIRQCPNPSWVVCDNGGIALEVKILPGMTNKLVGKPIKVALVYRDLMQQYEQLP